MQGLVVSALLGWSRLALAAAEVAAATTAAAEVAASHNTAEHNQCLYKTQTIRQCHCNYQQ